LGLHQRRQGHIKLHEDVDDERRRFPPETEEIGKATSIGERMRELYPEKCKREEGGKEGVRVLKRGGLARL
jgi:hypothetical protein